MRIALLVLLVLAAGCDSGGPDVERVELDLAGAVRVAETGAAAPGLDVYLQGELLSEPDVVVLLDRVTSGADGAYALRFDVPVLRRAAAGGCVARAQVGDERQDDVRLTLSVSDGAGRYATAVPACTGEAQIVDLVLRPLF